MPLYWAKAFWLLLNAAFLYRIWRLSFDYLPLARLPRKRIFLLTFLSLLFSIRFLRDNFHSCQVTICILYLTLEGLALVHRGKAAAGAALIALAINIKLLPLVILPCLFYRGEARSGVAVIAFYALSLLLPSLFIGHEYNTALLHDWWSLVNPTNAEHVIDVSERGLHGLSTLLPLLLMSDVQESGGLPIRRHLADLSAEKVGIILTAARLVLVAFTLYFLRTAPGRRAPSRIHALWETSYNPAARPAHFSASAALRFFLRDAGLLLSAGLPTDCA